MNNYQIPPPIQKVVVDASVEHSLFSKVFLWMAGALAVTALAALATTGTSLQMMFVTNPMLLWGAIIVELGLVIVLSARINKMSFATAAVVMILYSLLNGVTLSLIFLIYTAASIVKTFFIAAGMFGVMALIGATTKRNIGAWSRYLYMVLIGLIIAIVVNIFFKSSMMDWIISGVAVVLFTILTAVDTNRIKRVLAEMSQNGADTATLNKVALLGSLTLYLDFINLFIYLLRFVGSRN